MNKNRRINRLLSRLAVGLMLAAMALFTGCPNKITVKPETFAVTFSAGEHGTLKAKADGVTETDKSPINVEKDKTVTFTAKPADGYEVEKWTVTGSTFENGSGTVGNTTAKVKITAAVTVKVLFKAKLPAAVAVTEVKLDKSELTLEAGKSEQLTATVLPAKAANKTVTWSSDKPDIASVDKNGTVTAHKVGEAVITVTSEDGGKTASCKVNVTAKPPTTYKITFSVDGTGGSITAKVGDTEIHTGDTVEQGKTVIFTATPVDANHKVKEWQVDGVVISNTTTSHTLTVTKAINVTVSFKGIADGHAWYKVEHYQENTDGTYPSTPAGIEENLSGAKGASLSIGTGITLKGYSGFEFDKLEPAAPTIAADGSTVVKVLYKRKTINVTFNLDGGNIGGNTGDKVIQGKYGTPLNAPNNPDRANHVFKGWSPKLTATFPDHDSVHTAQWTALHTIAFSVDGPGGTLKAMVDGSEIHTGDKVEQDKIVTFTATPNSDYKVKEWKVDDAVVIGNASTTYTHTVTKGVEVKVSFESNSVPPTPPSGDVGSFEDTGDGFIKISPPAAGITGQDPTHTLPGTDDYWKGVFIKDRKVKLSPYLMGKTEVPYELWYEVRTWAEGNGYVFANKGREGKAGTNGAPPTTENKKHPVTVVSWRDCIVWCNAYTHKTNNAESECVYRKSKTDTTVLKDATKGSECDAAYADMSKKGFRLPTEAEWEYAARWQGSDSTNAEKYGEVWLTKLNSASGAKADWNNADETKAVAWYGDNSDSKTHPAGEKRKNALGLHDMSGNVWEWCFDRYDNDPRANDAAYTSGGFVVDPQGAASGDGRVVRGGGWDGYAESCVVGGRSFLSPDSSHDFLGFRVAMSKN